MSDATERRLLGNSKGGQATVKKGIGAISPERRAQIQRKALKTRRRNAAARKRATRKGHF